MLPFVLCKKGIQNHEIQRKVIGLKKIPDFPCTYDNSVGIREEVTKELNLVFPQAYKDRETMAAISLALKKHDNTDFCQLPFCHTVEGEALGGCVNYGDGKTGPRAKEPICYTPQDVLDLPEISYHTGRIHEVLKACESLSKQGETVVLEIAGPFTILNVLADAAVTFKWLRKEPEAMKLIFDKLKAELLRYMEQACRAGVKIISYADSTGGVNIIGPVNMEKTVEQFTYPLLKEAHKILPRDMLIHLCPKTSLALISTGKAQWKEQPLSKTGLSYGNGMEEMLGKARFVGEACIKDVGRRLEEAMKIIELR